MSRPWFPFYVGDYTRDTARLTTEAHGAYLLLMLDYWVNGAPPDDDETLATITKLPVTTWKKRRPVLVKFFKIEDGVWLHGRIEKEREKANTVGAANSDKAREAAERRWAMERERKLAEHQEASTGHAPSIPDDAPSMAGALLQNAQSQPHSLSKPKTDSKKGESNSPSKVLKVVGEGEGEPILIDETYQPSDRAIEYAYSLGMKKADLDAEHRKFVTMSVASRAKSFNPDMSFKLFCDRWLEFKRKNNPDWQPAPDIVRAPPEPFVLVIQGTVEAAAWNQSNREKGLRPLFFCKQVVDGVEIIAARCPSLVPPGYDEATGEKLAPNSEEHAA